MGKNGKRRGGDADGERSSRDESHESGQVGRSYEHDNDGSHREFDNGYERSTPQTERHNGGSSKHQKMPQEQAEINLTPYLEIVNDLRAQLGTCQESLKRADSFYSKQEREIQQAAKTKKSLEELKIKNGELKITVSTLQNLANDAEEKYRLRLTTLKDEEDRLKMARMQTEEDQKKIKEEEGNLKKRIKAIEAEQAVKLDEQRKKLEKEHDEQYRKRVENLEKETKDRRDEDSKRVADLEAENKKLSEKIFERTGELKQAEKNCKEARELKDLYEERTEALQNKLKGAENEFGLNSGSDEFYKEKFIAIYKDIQEISLRYFKELQVGNLDAVNDTIQDVDESFKSVPISTSDASEKLRVAHAKRVISFQLRDIIWQPFSSEITFQETKYVSLLNQISKKLVTSTSGGGGSHRAARVHAALTMRALQSQSSSSTSRAEAFTDKVMAILSVLVKPDFHPNLRNNLSDLAKSSISLWNDIQTDVREFTVYPDLQPETCEDWHEKLSADNSGVIVLLPYVAARRYTRMTDNRTIGLPGMWVDSEPEYKEEEICIHRGEGLGEWSTLVIAGEEEEQVRKSRQKFNEIEEKRKELEEEKKRLESYGTKRRISQDRRGSISGSASTISSPTAAWMQRGGQKIPERED